MRTLAVSAWAPELDGAELPPDVERREIGVGLVEAAAGAERALAELEPDLIVLVGTCGSLPQSDLRVGQVVIAKTATLVLREGEYAPAPMARIADADAELSARLAERLAAPLVTCASPLGITSDDREAARLAYEGAQIEQLECFALLRAAARRDVPAIALFAVANRVGKDAQAEWRANRFEAENAAKRALAIALAKK